MKITVEALVKAPVDTVWRCWTTPQDIIAWNAASDDWHTTAATVDLREGGRFSSRMEARDGSMGFDFAGLYRRVEPPRLLQAVMADGREILVEFLPRDGAVLIRGTFDAEDQHPPQMQRQGWQAILDRFAAHVEGVA